MWWKSLRILRNSIYKDMNKKVILREWGDLPRFMRVPEIRPYYEILNRNRTGLVWKRRFDFVFANIMLVVLFIPMLVIAGLIKLDSTGPVFYRQERVTAYGKRFWIHKFRTMVKNADKMGTTVTTSDDNRVTRIGRVLRKYRLDELPQLIDIINGDMSFVGTRPEVPKYVSKYTPEMYATLLMPAGVTSEASIRYKEESGLLDKAEDVDSRYLHDILPVKMVWNLESIKKFRLDREIVTMIRTIFAVMGKEYS